jgi:hypothetical protein
MHACTRPLACVVCWQKEEGKDAAMLTRGAVHAPHARSKVDKFGRPVYIELLGKLDTAKLLHTTTEERLIDYHIFTWERFHKQLAPACSALCGKAIVTTTVILDLKGVGLLSHFTLATQRLLSHLSHIDQVGGHSHVSTASPLIHTLALRTRSGHNKAG